MVDYFEQGFFSKCGKHNCEDGREEEPNGREGFALPLGPILEGKLTSLTKVADTAAGRLTSHMEVKFASLPKVADTSSGQLIGFTQKNKQQQRRRRRTTVKEAPPTST